VLGLVLLHELHRIVDAHDSHRLAAAKVIAH
jgi:hypothetical protein